MPTVHVNGVDFAVSDSGTGRPVLLVHGFPLDRTIWDEQVASLSSRWRVLAPDLRGFGRSGATRGKVTMQQFADDLAAMLDALAVSEPVVLTGLSMGGYIAFEFFRRHRDRLRAMILCDTRSAADTPQAAAGRREAADRVEREGPQVLADLMMPRMFAPATFKDRPDLVERLRRMIRGGQALGQAAAARGLADRVDFTSLLPRIDCPAVALVGAEDVISPPAEMRTMAEAIPGARLIEIAEAGHLAPLEKPAEVARAMAEFLSVL